MNDIEQLNERIAQLTELVKTGSEAIKNMETALKAAEEERDRLANQLSEQEPKFERVKTGRKYYCISDFCGRFEAVTDIDGYYSLDEMAYNNNNYFHTHKRAQEVADKINFLLRLERLHDMFCPDYVPDWSNQKPKYFVYYNHHDKFYDIDTNMFVECKSNVYFPSEEIARRRTSSQLLFNIQLSLIYKNI